MIFILFVAFFHFVCIENGFVADGIEKRKKNKCSLSNAIVCLIDWFDLNTMCMFLRMEFNLSTHTVNRWRKDKNRKKQDSFTIGFRELFYIYFISYWNCCMLLLLFWILFLMCSLFSLFCNTMCFFASLHLEGGNLLRVLYTS